MSNRRVESFLLRLVVQHTGETDTDVWRGRIQHVSSGYNRQFECLQDLIAFINEQLMSSHSAMIICDEQAIVE
jgi:hypothetical protein